MEKAADLVREIQAVWVRVDADGREPYPREQEELKSLLSHCESAQLLEKVGGGAGPAGPAFFSSMGGDPGTRFIESQGYKQIKSGENRGQQWTSGLVDVGLSAKGTLLEGGGSPGSGTGGGWIAAPQVVPGMVPKLFQPLTVENLLLSGQATTSVVRYGVQGTATSAAAGVAEAGTKPKSTMAFSTLDEPIRKVATVVQISDELLDDAPAVQAFVNNQLSMFVQIEVERQLFRGTSGGNEVQGILTSRGVPVYAGGTAAGNKAVQLFKAMNGVRGSAFTEPEWVVIHPTDYQDIRLLTDTAGQLMGGGPFMGPYGNGQGVAASGQIAGAQDSLWGKQVYVTSPIGGAGTALVGSQAAGQVWSRGGVVVEAPTRTLRYS